MAFFCRSSWNTYSNLKCACAVVLATCCLTLMPHATANDETSAMGRPLHFSFVTLSSAGEIAGVLHQLAMNGSGEFNFGHVKGGGSFNHYDGNAPVPQTFVASGTWQARNLISWFPVGPNAYGEQVSGVLEIEIVLFPAGGPPQGIPATLQLSHNVPPAGLFTGRPEGIVLEAALRFEPLGPPPVGIAVVTLGPRQR